MVCKTFARRRKIRFFEARGYGLWCKKPTSITRSSQNPDHQLETFCRVVHWLDGRPDDPPQAEE